MTESNKHHVKAPAKKVVIDTPDVTKIDRNIGQFSNTYPKLFGDMEYICRDIMIFMARNAKDINNSMFKEFAWDSPSFVRSVNSVRSKIVGSWEKELTEPQIQGIVQRYGDPRENPDYDWVKSKLELGFYILQQVKMSYSVKISDTKRTVKTFGLIDDITIETKGLKKHYFCKVDQKFLERCLKTEYFNLLDYPNVPQVYRNLHLWANQQQAYLYYMGKLTKTVAIDDLVEVCGIKEDQKASDKKNAVLKKLNKYIANADKKGYARAFDSYEITTKETSKVEGYYIKLNFPFSSKAESSLFNYRDNEDFKKLYEPKIKHLFQTYSEERAKQGKWEKSFDEWYKSDLDVDPMFRNKVRAFVECFRLVFEKDVSAYPKILKQEFGIDKLPY